MADKEHENDPKTPATEAAQDGAQEAEAPPTQPAAGTKEEIKPSATVAPAPRRGGRGLAVFALLLALIAGGAVAYLFYQIEWVQKLDRVRQSAALDRQLDTLGKNVKELAERNTSLQQAQQALLQNVNDKINTRLADLDKQQQALTESLQKVYAQLNRNLDSWALEEVEQLLRIANHSLVLNRDVPTAIAGLELADARLKDQGDPSLLPVRRQIANDIAALKVVPQVDVSGITLRLGSMRDTVAKLPLQQQPQRELAGKPAQTAAATGSNWLASTKELLSDSLGVIRIQNITKPVRPLLTPEQRHYLQANLRLMLGGAQLAALHGDELTYRDNLKQAQGWLGEYFDQADGRVTKTIDDLASMQKLELKPQLPDISGSISALETAKQKTADTAARSE